MAIEKQPGWSFPDFMAALADSYRERAVHDERECHSPYPTLAALYPEGLPQNRDSHVIEPPDPRVRLDRLLAHEWPQNVPAYTAVRVVEFLQELCLPGDMLPTLFGHLPTTLADASPEGRWLRLCIAFTPPFHTQDPQCVQDLSPPIRNPGRHWYWKCPGVACTNREGLLATLGQALYTFELGCRNYHDGASETLAQVRESLLGDAFFLMVVRDLRRTRRLPDELHDFPSTRTLTTLVSQVQERKQRLVEAWARADLGTVMKPVEYVRMAYDYLLADMRQAFHNANLQPPQYPASALYKAMSAVLTPLLRLQDLPLNKHCITRDAIKKRLQRRDEFRDPGPAPRPAPLVP